MERGHNWGAGCTVGAVVVSGSYIGKIVAVRPRSFDAEFEHTQPLTTSVPKITGGEIVVTITHFKRRFRRRDGRSMGGKICYWANPPAPGIQGEPK